MSISSKYKFESELVDEFLSILIGQQFGADHINDFLTEFNYSRGRTDIVAYTEDGKIIAFEAKLADWKEALHQAYRNRCFAHYSYVLVPPHASRLALNNFPEFDRRSIGICFIDDSELHIALESPEIDPVQPWLTKRVIDEMSDWGKRNAAQ